MWPTSPQCASCHILPQRFSISISFGPDVRKTDISSLTRAHLASLRTEINAAAGAAQDPMTRYHLQDLSDRIRRTLDPK